MKVNKFIRELKRRGWRLEPQTSTGHKKMSFINGGYITFASTPSDIYWVNNARRDADKIEKLYGSYIKTRENLSDKMGLDYIKPQGETMELVNNKVPFEIVMPTENKTDLLYRPPIVSNKSLISLPNKDFIVTLLKKRRDELCAQLAPYKHLLDELEQVAESLKSLTGEITTVGKSISVVKPDEDKIQDFIQNNEITRNSTRYKPEDVYRQVKEVVKAHNYEMKISELTDWAEEVLNIKPSNSQSVREKILAYIHTYNNNNPGKACLMLYPEKDPNSSYRGKAYVSIKFKEGFITS